MARPGPRNLITDVAGLRIGQAEDIDVRSGTTVMVMDSPALAAVDIRGGAPGTRETRLLETENLVGEVDAIVLSGGSAFGLEAASGVMQFLAENGRGFRVGRNLPPVPIVPAAILFDLNNGGDKGWAGAPPYRDLGYRAAQTASEEFSLGNAGAGYGAVAGRFKGGLGSASYVTDDGFTIGAIVAVNALGSPCMPGSDVFWAYPFERDSEFGGRLPDKSQREIADLPSDMKGTSGPGENTTIAIVATDAVLDRMELKRLAIMAADGFARALRPSHTPFDGDLVFAISTARLPDRDTAQGVLRLGTLAADCLSRAIARGVHEAVTLGDLKSCHDAF